MGALVLMAQYRYPDHMDGAWGWAMAVFMIAVVVGVAALLFWLVNETRGRGGYEKPAEILDRRLASGEITPEEYRERSALLGNRKQGSAGP